MASAKALFEAYGPATEWSKEQKANMTAWGSLLDSYNNGLLGPLHCSY